MFTAQTVLQLHKFEAHETRMHDKNAKKIEEEKALIHLSLFLKETPNMLLLR